jgi:hypothetical protein
MGLLVLDGPGATDGLDVQNHLSRLQVINRSRAIFVARLVWLRNEYDTAQAHGKMHRYVTRRRAFVRIQRVVAGRAFLRKRLGRSQGPQWLWLTMKTPGRPGKWVRVREHYYSTFGLNRDNIGKDFIVYVPENASFTKDTHTGGHRMEVRYLDSLRHELEVKRLIRLVRRLGDKVARWPSRCLSKGTFWLRGQCLARSALKRALRCPDASQQRLTMNGKKLEIHCRDADGARHGPTHRWHANGELAERAYHGRGRLVGVRETFFDNGRRRCRIPYRAGRVHGRKVCWWSNGRVASIEPHLRGAPAGRVLRLDEHGRVSDARCVRGGEILWKTRSRQRARQWPCPVPGGTTAMGPRP